ncbi:probable methyltransferase-like protein 24 [Ptychodera flava]|uniref:probable methyltransferase-like protein 24 n=1 Tax=Ptychodera flava TaxID=63121 RepID=UPI00396A550D
MKKITTPRFTCPKEGHVKDDGDRLWSLCLDSVGHLYSEIPRNGVCKLYVTGEKQKTGNILQTTLEHKFQSCRISKTSEIQESLVISPSKDSERKQSNTLMSVDRGIQLLKLEARMDTPDTMMTVTLDDIFLHVDHLLLEVNLTCDDAVTRKRKIMQWQIVVQQLTEMGFSLGYVHTNSESKVDIGLEKKYPCCYTTTWVKTFSPDFSLAPWAGNSVADETRRLLAQITTLTDELSCGSLKRVGNTQDGGWTLCFDKKLGLWDKPCTLYSFGIANDWSFDKSMADYGCEVFAFDPSIGIERRVVQERVWFYNIGLSDRNSDEYYGMGMGKLRSNKWRVRTLDGVRRELGHSKRKIDVMKIDIEGSEWGALRHMLENGSLQFVKQLVFEIHLWHERKTEQKEELRLRYSILKALEDQGFHLVNWHKNPMSTAVNLGRGYTQGACCYELTYVNKRFNDWWV